MGGSPSITDWIIAGASVFAAVGTVSAVVVALWQSARRDRRSVLVEGALGMGTPEPTVLARFINDGYRPVTVQFAPYIVAQAIDDPSTTVAIGGEASIETYSDTLPKTLEDGESLQFVWNADQVEGWAESQRVVPLYFQMRDVHGNFFHGPYPGVKARRKKIPWQTKPRYDIPKVRFRSARRVE